MNNSNTTAPPVFEPASLLTLPTTTNPWLVDNMPSTLAVRSFGKWLKFLPISEAQRAMLTTNIAKTEAWWGRQPAEALETVQRVAVMMGIPVSLMSQNYDVTNFLRAMTAAISMTNWLAPSLRKKLKHKVLQSHLQALHSMILVIYILTPFTMASTLSLFQGFRIIQTRMMVLSVIHGLRPNQKLKAILEGCGQSQPFVGIFAYSPQPFCANIFPSQCVYIRFTHIMNMQLDREYSRSRRFFQLTKDKLVQAELALRYWKEHDNLYIWAPVPIFTERADYRCLELAWIQEWQPRLNYPFICQFFHPRKGILKKPAMNTNAQFGLATLWRWSKHKFTPQVVKDILASERFQHRPELWNIIHSLPGVEYKNTIWTNQNAPIQWWRPHFVLCITPSGKQHPGALSHPFPSSHRRLHHMVARETCTTSLTASCSLVFKSKSSTRPETISPKMASTSFGLPSPVPHAVFQNGLHQARSSVGPTLQTQTGHISMVHRTKRHILLPAPVQIQKSNPE